jgi:hypothetical protein
MGDYLNFAKLLIYFKLDLKKSEINASIAHGL